MEYIITFKNTSFAIKAEKCLLERRLNISVMPLPSKIRAGCGICLRLPPDELPQALAALKENGIDEINLYSKDETTGEVLFAEVQDLTQRGGSEDDNN